jgi:protein-S-isoprenylcysteine O-methyltransferase Ste14
MRLKSILLGLTFALFGGIVIPYYLIRLNDYFSLPILFNSALTKIVGFLLIAVGLYIFLYCSKIFVSLGKGTPVPIEPPKKLVAQGLYKYSRNPIYIGYFLILLGEFLFFGYFLQLIYCLLAVLSFHLLVIYYEEPRLKKRFDKFYLEYLKKVPRWI